MTMTLISTVVVKCRLRRSVCCQNSNSSAGRNSSAVSFVKTATAKVTAQTAAARMERRGDAALQKATSNHGATTLSSRAVRPKYTANGLSENTTTASAAVTLLYPRRRARAYITTTATSLQTKANSRPVATA